jgi:hypothetical protein
MKQRIIFLIAIFLLLQSKLGIWYSAAIVLFIFYLLFFIANLSDEIPFRQFILVLYSLNYLLSPAILMNLPNKDDLTFEKIGLSPERFFGITIPAILALHLGLYTFKIKIFKPNFNFVKLELLVNESLLRKFVLVGIFFSFYSDATANALGYILHLISLLKYVGIFGLFVINYKKNWIYIAVVFLLSIQNSLSRGMFGDFVQWTTFFGMLVLYVQRVNRFAIYIAFTLSFIFVFLLQAYKNDYREKIWNGTESAGIQTMIETSKKSENNFFDTKTLSKTLERFNQSWIFSSVIEKMDITQDYQEFELLMLYTESALLPRFLAPNKLNSSDKELFTKYTGHILFGSTSMGMGILADGYISFGYWGTIVFSFFLGIFISLVCKVIEKWINISPFFLFFLFPVLFYAIRPDCDTQTLLGNLFKSLVLYGLIVFISKQNLRRVIKQKKVLEIIPQ